MEKEEATELISKLDIRVQGLLEDISRAIAKGHFMRKQHYGVGSQEERVMYLVNQGWRNFLPDALFVVEALHSRMK